MDAKPDAPSENFQKAFFVAGPGFFPFDIATGGLPENFQVKPPEDIVEILDSIVTGEPIDVEFSGMEVK